MEFQNVREQFLSPGHGDALAGFFTGPPTFVFERGHGGEFAGRTLRSPMTIPEESNEEPQEVVAPEK
jgi:hypothetical protein